MAKLSDLSNPEPISSAMTGLGERRGLGITKPVGNSKGIE